MEYYFYNTVYKPLTKVQRKNISDWLNFYQSTYHIAEFRAEKLAFKNKDKKWHV